MKNILNKIKIIFENFPLFLITCIQKNHIHVCFATTKEHQILEMVVSCEKREKTPENKNLIVEWVHHIAERRRMLIRTHYHYDFFINSWTRSYGFCWHCHKSVLILIFWVFMINRGNENRRSCRLNNRCSAT